MRAPTKASERLPPLFKAAIEPIQAFLRLEAAGGILLFAAALAALVWANLDHESYERVFTSRLLLGAGDASAAFTVREAINDGLMAVFFFVVGLEIKRELTVGELDSLAKASLPAVAALGGMIVPAAIFLGFTKGGPGAVGWGVPMATDIAFSLGILTLLKDRVSRSLVVFLTALAIFDDIGGILVIALFYGSGIHWPWLGIAAVLTVIATWIGRAQLTRASLYLLVGVGLWYAVHHAGIHATIAGVILGLAVPARSRTTAREALRGLAAHAAKLLDGPDRELDDGDVLAIEQDLEELESPVERFLHALHPVAVFAIVPLFALANSGIPLTGMEMSSVLSPVAVGVAAGLAVGKPVGIFCFTYLAVRLARVPMLAGVRWMQLFGVSVLAGVGFTVALFIAALAYQDQPRLLDEAKVGIMVASVAAGGAGFLLLRFSSRDS